jgi:hypothetical protein
MDLKAGQIVNTITEIPLYIPGRKYRGKSSRTKFFTTAPVVKNIDILPFIEALDIGDELVFSHRTASRTYSVDYYFTVPSKPRLGMVAFNMFGKDLDNCIVQVSGPCGIIYK